MECRLIIPKRNAGNTAVTSFYMELIKKSIEKTGRTCTVSDVDFNGNKKEDFIIVDDIFRALSVIKKGYKNIIIWVQGIIPEESYMRNNSKLRYFILNLLEKFVLKKVKFVFFCSDEMKKHYEKKYNMNFKNYYIMPCFNENEINHSAFDYVNKFKENTFLYVGSIKEWQCFEETIELYKKIEDTSEEDTKLFVFTGQQDEALEIIEKHKLKNYEVSYAKKEELNEKIKNCKYGFVIRKDNAVNNVATPTKFSNYISNGIIPIYSSCIKDFSNIDSKYQLGVIYDLDEKEEGLQSILNHMSLSIKREMIITKCKNIFKNYYNDEKYIEEISKIIECIF